MKMVKSLFLGSAAGLVAMTGAQAADLPVKAKPVQYVKICSLYGAGFYYIPGTDMCLKIGGYARLQVAVGSNGNLTLGPLVLNAQTRATQNFAERVRGYITADARNQTEYGTVRSYLAVGYAQTNINGAILAGGPGATDSGPVSPGFSSNRGFIQFAGFTFGLTQSFYDFHATPALSFYGGAVNPSSDTGDGGKTAVAYTAQFGGGMSGSISLEAPRTIGVYNSGAGATLQPFFGAAPTSLSTLAPSSQHAVRYPDLVANLRVDQAWGSAQVMGAIHDVSGQYYGPTAVNTGQGHPAEKIGFAVGAGAKILAPSIGAGDYFSFQANYSQGATGYPNAVGGAFLFYNGSGPGSSLGYGVVTDGVYGGSLAGANTTGVNLTTAWGVNAGYEHFWNRSFQTSLYGAYVAYSYNAEANASLCFQQGATTAGTLGGSDTTITPGVTCNNNFAVFTIGSRTQWNIDSNTAMGVDIAYLGLKSAQIGNAAGLVNAPTFGAQAAAVRTVGDQHTWLGQFRIHRNFYP